MKKFNYLLILLLSFQLIGYATTYFYAGSGDITNIANWSTNPNGIGTPHPANFTTAGQVFNIQNTSSATLIAAWTVSGTGSIIQVGDSTNACTLTIPTGFTVTGTISVSPNAILNIANATVPTLGILSNNSTIIYSGTGIQSLQGKTYSNLSVSNNSGGTLNASGNVTVNNLLTILDGATLNMGTYSFTCGGGQYNTNFSTSNGGGSGTGKLSTKNTSGSGAITSNYNSYTWNFTVEYAASSGQTTSKGTQTYLNFISANNSANGVGLYTGAIVTGTLTINAGCTLSVGSTQTLAGNFNTSGTGILSVGNTSSTPLPSGETYSFDVYYNSTSAQTIMGGTYNGILNTTGGNRTFSSDTTITINSTFTQGSGTFSAGSSTVLFTGSRTLPNIPFYNLVLGAGTFNTPSSLTVKDDLTILVGATFNAPTGTLNIGDNFTNNGSFIHNNGTVVFNGTSQYIYGNTTFYNFTKSIAAADMLIFQSGSTQNIQGLLTLNGASGKLLSVYSSVIGSQANINPQGGRVINYLAVSGMNNMNDSVIVASNSLNYGNNTKWVLGNPNTTGDLEAVPNTWSTVNGSLAIDTNHYRLGSRSVAWNWNANDTLKITGMGFDPSLLGNYSWNTVDLSIYNTAAKPDSLKLQFFDKYNRLRYFFSVRLNYKGWYETIRSYRYNIFKPLSAPTTTDSITTVYIIAPKQGNGQLNFDNVNWIYKRTGTPMTLVMPDSLVKNAGLGGGSYPIYDDNTIYNLSPNVTKTIPTASEIADFMAVKASFMGDIVAASSVTSAEIAAANSYFASQGYSLNSDGTAKGNAIWGLFTPQGPYASFTSNFKTFAYAWYLNNDTVSLNKATIMLRYFLDNGNFAGGAYKIGTYDSPDFYIGLALLAEKIYAVDTALYSGLANYVKWDLDYGMAWMPDTVYSPVSTDNPRKQLMGYMAYPLLLIRDTATAIQNLRGFNQFISIFMKPNDGQEDNIKVDGSCFHHQGHYYNYTQPLYVTFAQWLYHLRNTQFKPDSVTYKRIRDVVYTFFLQQNVFNTSYGNKGEGQSDFFTLYNGNKYLSRLANLGKGITGSVPDYLLGCAYNRVFAGINDSTLPTTSYPAEAFPSGFTQLNYATLGLFRNRNWLSTIKMLNTDFWGVECGLSGSSGQRRDVYSRYLPYGSIDILYAGASNDYGISPLGYTFDAFKYNTGFDHRFPNGATTIVLNMDSLACNEPYGKEFAYTGSLAGSLSFQNRPTNFSFKTRGDFGLSAMKFQQASYNFNSGCKGLQRDTTFKFQKSWFAFDSIIICLGSGIQNKNGVNKTSTNLFQLTDSAQTIYVNGTADSNISFNKDLFGTGPYQLITPYQTGYYVKSSDSLHITAGNQQFNLKVDDSIYSSKGRWVNAWIDHGKAPTNKGYEYVIMPNTNPVALKAFSDSMINPNSAYYVVKQADSIMHRVYYKPKNIQGFAIFQKVDAIMDSTSLIKSVSKACYAMGINQGDSLLSLTVVDPNLNLKQGTAVSGPYPPNLINYSTLSSLLMTIRGSWSFVSNDTNIHIISTTDTTTILQVNTQYGLPTDAIFTSNSTTWNGISWSKGTPNSSRKVIVNANLTNTALLSSQSLSINTSDTIFNDGIIKISSGNLINNGVVKGNGNTLMNGSARQTISGNGTISNLTINNVEGVVISNGNHSLSINGVLTLVNGQLLTNGNLVLKSDSNSTGVLSPYGINGNGGSLNGTVTVQRYISAKTARKYSFIGCPISQSIHDSWQQQIYITGTGTGGSSCGNSLGNGVVSTDRFNDNGFDVTPINVPSMFIYNPVRVNGSRWISIQNTTNTNLSPGIGYKINIRGDRNSANVTCLNQLDSYNPTAPEAVTLSATGAVNSGDVSVSLNDPDIHPYTLLANPYPSHISFTAFQANNSNTFNKMWSYSPMGNGNYTTYSAGVIANGAIGYDNTSGDYLASGQAFFVQANAAGNVTFHESHKIGLPPPNTKYFGTNANLMVRIGLRDNTNGLLDEVVVRFNNQGSFNYNPYWDAASFSGSSHTLVTLKGDSSLSIATLPSDTDNYIIPIGIRSSNTGTYFLSFSDFEGMDSSVSLTLKDNFLSTKLNIRTSPFYNFTTTTDSNSQGNSRFVLMMKKKDMLLPVNKINLFAVENRKDIIINWTAISNAQVFYEIEKSLDGITFNRIGKTLSNSFTDSFNQNANTYYRIKAISEDGTVTYSNTIKLTSNHLPLTTMTIYPNPMIGRKVAIQMSNFNKGKYLVKVTNELGQNVAESTINCLGGLTDYSIDFGNISNGLYKVSIRKQGTNQLVGLASLIVQH